MAFSSFADPISMLELYMGEHTAQIYTVHNLEYF